MPVVLWVLPALMAALFLLASFAQLTSLQMEVDAVAMLPVGQMVPLSGRLAGVGRRDLRAWRRRGVFRPDLVPAPRLDSSHHGIHPIVIGAILVALIYLQRNAIRERSRM
jgi:hypothetical protein